MAIYLTSFTIDSEAENVVVLRVPPLLAKDAEQRIAELHGQDSSRFGLFIGRRRGGHGAGYVLRTLVGLRGWVNIIVIYHLFLWEMFFNYIEVL